MELKKTKIQFASYLKRIYTYSKQHTEQMSDNMKHIKYT
jgi:hypothetical protein